MRASGCGACHPQGRRGRSGEGQGRRGPGTWGAGCVAVEGAAARSTNALRAALTHRAPQNDGTARRRRRRSEGRRTRPTVTPSPTAAAAYGAGPGPAPRQPPPPPTRRQRTAARRRTAWCASRPQRVFQGRSRHRPAPRRVGRIHTGPSAAGQPPTRVGTGRITGGPGPTVRWSRRVCVAQAPSRADGRSAGRPVQIRVPV